MRDNMREAVGETVQGLVKLGLPTTFTKKQLDELGVVIPDVEVSPPRIREDPRENQTESDRFC